VGWRKVVSVIVGYTSIADWLLLHLPADAMQALIMDWQTSAYRLAKGIEHGIEHASIFA
jgi:hypothetical protein